MSDHGAEGQTSDPASALLLDGFARIADGVVAVLSGIDSEQLTHRPAPEANPIGWLIWHLTRQADAQLSDLVGADQVWTGDGWAARFALPYPEEAMGYGMDAAQVAAFPEVDPELLIGYQRATHGRSVQAIGSLSPARLDEIIDRSWDPPVTVAVRLMSVLEDAQKHLGQAEYLRGL